MNLEELKEQIQQNLWDYIDTLKPEYLEIDKAWVRDDILDVVEQTFIDAFFAPAPISLDSAPQN
jgi:hypothetical protein